MKIKQLIIKTLSHKLLILIPVVCIIASALLLIIFLPPDVANGNSLDVYKQIKNARYWYPENISKVDEAQLAADYDAAQAHGLKLCERFLRHYPDDEKTLLVKLHQIDFLWALGLRDKMLKRMEDFLRKHPKNWRKVAYVEMLLAEEAETPIDEKSRYYLKLAEIFAQANTSEKCAEAGEKAILSAKSEFSQRTAEIESSQSLARIYRRLADIYAKTYQHDIAIGEYQKAVELAPGDYLRNRYRLLLADCFHRTGKPDVAQKIVTGVRESTKDSLTKFEAEEKLLYIAADMGHLDEYISELKSKVGSNATLHEILGRAYERKQDYPNAIRTYTKAIALGVEVHYAPLINLCCEANLHDEGIAIIKKAIKTHPEKPAFRAQLGYFLGECGEYEEGIAQYKRAIKLAKGKKHKSELRLWLGRLYRKAGEKLQAEDEWESIVASQNAGAELKREAEEEIFKMYDAEVGVDELLKLREARIKAKPNDVASLRILSRTYWQMRDYDNAISIYETIMRLVPESDDVWQMLANAYEEKRLYDKAISMYQKLIEFAPLQNAKYLINIAKIESRRRRGGEPTKIALELGEKLATQKPQNAELHLRLADIYFQHGNLNKSVAEYKKAIDIIHRNQVFPKNLVSYAYNRLATIYARRREDGKIIDLAEQLKAHCIADMPLLYHTLGKIYTRGSFYDDAVATYEKAVQLSPNRLQFRRDLAEAYERIKEFEKAEAEYDRVTEMAPLWERLEIRQRRGKIDKLLDVAKQIITLPKDRENEVVSLVIGVFAQNGQLDRLISTLEGNIAQKPDDIAAMKILAAVHLSKEHPQQATNLYAKITLLRPSDGTSFGNLGKTYYLQELYAKAVTAYKKAVNLNPERFEYKEALARCYEKTGQTQLASAIRKYISNKYGEVRGTVRQVRGKETLANVHIQYVGPAGIKGETHTDAQGNYRFENLVWGRYLLRASLDGYAVGDRLCLVSPESETEQIFFLAKATDVKTTEPKFPMEAPKVQKQPAYRPVFLMRAPSFIDENAVEPRRQAAYAKALALMKEGTKAQKGRKQKLQQAITLFNQIAQKYPRTVASDFSRIQIAICYQLLRDWNNAAKSYENLVNKYARKYSKLENIPREHSRKAAIYAKDSFIKLSSYVQSVRVHRESMRKLGYLVTQ